MSAQPLDIRMAHLEGAYEQVVKRLESIDHRLETLDRKIDTSQWRIVSLVVGTWLTLMLAIFLHKP
jgi:hypothetical protein